MKILRFDPALHPSQFPDRAAPDEEDVLRDFDELFQSLGAGRTMRRVVRLRLLEMSHRAIAERCKIPEHAVCVQLSRARKLLEASGVLETCDRSEAAAAEHKDRRGARIWGRSAHGAAEKAARPRPVASPDVIRAPADGPLPVKGEPYRIPGRLTAAQAFGWRDVYYSEVHRCDPHRWDKS